MRKEDQAIDDDGSVFEPVQFDYDEVDRRLHAKGSIKHVPDSPIELAGGLFKEVLKWVYQPPGKDLNGINDRAWVIMWIFLDQLRSSNMTELAGMAGKHKQSIGRQVTHFKKTFPQFSKYLRHLKYE